MKIQFKQQGGAMPPYLTYTPFIPSSQPIQQQQRIVEQKPTQSDKDSLNDKDLMDMIKEINGLPNDMGIVITNLKQMEQLKSINPVASNQLTTIYLNSLYRLKVANFNKTEYDHAYTEVKENSGLSELAITENGYLTGINKETGKLQLFSVQDYLSNPYKFDNDKGKYQILTNSNLLWMRAHSPQFAFDNKVLSIVENGIGLEKINKLIKDNLQTLGKTKNSVAFNIYQKDDKIAKGAEVVNQLLQNGLPVNTSLDGLYEGKVITEDQKNQAQAALLYIYKSLPKNAQTLLKIKAGNASDPDKGAFELLQTLIFSTTSSSTDLELNFKGGYNPDGSKKSDKEETGSIDKVKYNAAAQFALGVGYSSQFVIQDGTHDGLLIYSTEMPATKNNQPIGRSTLFELTSSDASGILDFQNVSMGGLKIDPSGFSKVLTDGVLHSVDMIIDQQAARNGVIKPDFRLFKKKEQADQYIKDNNINRKDYNKVNEVYKQFGLPVLYNSNGKLNTNSYARFAVLNGDAISTAFSNNDQSDVTFNDYLRELNDQDEANVLSEFKKIDNKLSYDEKSFWDSISPILNSHDSIYTGTIYIPIKSHILNAMAGQPEGLTGDQINTLEALEQNKDRANQLAARWKNGNNRRE